MRRELRSYYGWSWRTVDRPAALKARGGRFDKDGRYIGGAKCLHCPLIDLMPNGKSQLDCCHLTVSPGEPGHLDPDNLTMLCRSCHRKLDQPKAGPKAKETRLDRKDGARWIPPLGLLEIR